MRHKKNKKRKNQKGQIPLGCFWLLIIIVLVVFGLGWCVVSQVQRAYVDAFPFSTNWSVVGDGQIIKCELKRLEGKGRKKRPYYEISFVWYFNNSEKKYEGKSISYNLNFKVGDKVTIVAYKGNPHKTKIIDTLVTTTLPGGVYCSVLFPFIICLFLVFCRLYYGVP
jgi:hypothetical protein